jgi:hypothetical protein
MYFVGCPCQYNAARKGWDSFFGAYASSGFNVEDLVVNLDFYITGLTRFAYFVT